MRHLMVLALLASAASPALAAQPSRSDAASVPPEIVSGQLFDELGTMIGALSRAFLNLPIGEVEAAVENRPVTRADRARTVGSATGMSERELQADIEQGKVAMKAGGQAVARSLPVIVDALNKAGEEIERATANLPQPGYPRR